ncbi:universal stress protein [Cellulomonas sp. zg-ZUI222]|uniref:Universal stress protein n=1 Tax=Cellulomonas wangleii TaxID=2816956 RepID=A0ABX8D7R8_9CELL|nr:MULTISPECIES: universal stress protein [Cellulomonas]MBO0900950.1 universal stress protein [Cellulomonas sp. zg-ZUI22]MBO0921605.1 universal stress protein [Cellulomonas wangleii]MBO0925101.1 universal stress protein [Cellulomonas wangleii]QVI63486.1 universal stress protein [Cellulomonas wangleii]
MTEHVVAGYDGSPEAVAAVRWAAGSAQRLGLPLQVVHVWGLAGQLDTPPTRAASAYVRDGAREVAEEGAQVAREAVPGIEVEAVLDDGPPARALVDRAVDAPLIVLGRQGSARLSGVLMGSVALATLQHAPCPVVIVPRTSPEEAPTDLVVVGVDGSRQALGAVEAAGRYAARTGARLRVVACWQGPLHGRSLADWVRDHPDVSPDDVARRAAEDSLERARTLLRDRYPDVQVETLVEEGPAARVLARHAEKADLLVVGTRGRSGLAGLVLGSVSQWLVARAACPVLVSRTVTQ